MWTFSAIRVAQRAVLGAADDGQIGLRLGSGPLFQGQDAGHRGSHVLITDEFARVGQLQPAIEPLLRVGVTVPCKLCKKVGVSYEHLHRVSVS